MCYVVASATTYFQTRYHSLFPNKNLLQLKIREVRQRMMAESQTGERDQPVRGGTDAGSLASVNPVTSESDRMEHSEPFAATANSDSVSGGNWMDCVDVTDSCRLTSALQGSSSSLWHSSRPGSDPIKPCRLNTRYEWVLYWWWSQPTLWEEMASCA